MINLRSFTRKRTATIITISIVLISIVVFFSCKSSNDDMTYKKVPVTRGNLSVEIVSTGEVQPENRLEIKPPIAGRVDEVKVLEGQVVKKGDVLVLMSSTERAALMDAARARGPAELKKWQEFYKATPVLAPIDGTIILRAVEPGQSFTSSDAVLVMSDRLTIKAQVDETDIAKIKVGQKATIILDAYSDEKIPAVVDKVAYDATTVSNVTTYIVDVLPEVTPEFMRSGMTANINFAVDTKENALIVPVSAVKKSGDRSLVMVPPTSRMGKSTEREVILGMTNGKMVEVLSGISDGESILVLKPNNTDESSSGTPLFQPPKRR